MSKNSSRKYVVCGLEFDVGDSYEVVGPVGQGSYGVVCSARHNDTGELVAIKKITSIYRDEYEAKRTLREIQLLSSLQHENVIAIREILTPMDANADGDEDIYVVFELMESDLYQISASSQELLNEHIQYFLYQLLRGLKYLHSSGVIHRDLKPENLLINSDCDLKIADFGLARVMQMSDDGASDTAMTQYVATRWYRAPEIMLSPSTYSQSIDIWSTGCILADLLNRAPLFPGNNYIDQLQKIFSVVGSPSADMLESLDSGSAERFLSGLPHYIPVPFEEILPDASAEALDLLSKMLKLKPEDRISAAAALEHPYFKHLHDPSDEPDGHPISLETPTSDETSCSNIKRLIIQTQEQLLDQSRLRRDAEY